MYTRGGGLPILSPEQPQTLPPAFRLEQVVLNLQARGDLRSLIGLVEAWSANDEPSPVARLAQARALVQLGLVDRAWARIQGMVDAEGASAETLCLTAELFLARQWPKRARDVLNRGLKTYPDDPTLKALWDRMSEPATTPDLDAIDDEQADVSSLITAAHHLMASGSHTLARTLLDRAQKLDADHTQVADMLWALEGDFSIDDSLAELVRRHQADLSQLADIDDEPEHTESIDATQIGLPPEPEKAAGAFPNLFRDLEPRTEMLGPHDFDSVSDEITKVTSMMDLSSMDTIQDRTFSGEHTEIQRVITHQTLGDEPEPELAFDLSSLESDLTSPELEDDDVVVITRREEDTQPDEEEPSKLVLDDTTPGPPATRKGAAPRKQADEAETWILPQQELELDDPPEDAPKKKAKKPKKRTEPKSSPPLPDATDESFDNIHDAFPATGSTVSVWLVAIAGILALAALLLLLLVGLGLVSG